MMRGLIAGLILWLVGVGPVSADPLREREWHHVRDVLFTALADSTYAGDRVTRWNEQPVVILIGASGEDRAYVMRVIETWNRLMGESPIRIEDVDRGQVNIGILFATSETMPAMAARHGMQADIAKRGAGYTELSVRPDHAALISVTLIKDELGGDERKATLIHELYHALGPSGHSRDFPESVVFQTEQETSTALALAPIDVKVLALLYRYLSPGDTEAQVRDAFDRHWDELDRLVAIQ